MKWPKSRHADEPIDTAALEETPAEQPQTAISEDDRAVDAATETDASDHNDQPTNMRPRIRVSRVIAYGILPGLALLLASAAGFLKWQDASAGDANIARTESVRAATDSTIALLSYRPDTVEKNLGTARDRLAGQFKDSYTSLVHDLVIPGAKQKQISAVATVPAAASRSATENHAVVLLFVNQTIIVGQDAPTSTASSVRVTLDKVNGQWLISGFDPV